MSARLLPRRPGRALKALLPLLFALAGPAALGAIDFYSKGEPAEIARAIADSMTAEELVGQLFMVSYPDAEPSAEFLSSLGRRGLGGVKIFGWNAKDDTVLCASIGVLQKKALAGRFRVPL